ncbi:phage Gp37/Gp68 family protein [Variovorax sp. V59]|uniref:phage Gp37/Gp68 family protein n=1 Tax=unclassified Variovorax TaxID=663243 RepID=UPI0034E8E0E5
MAETTNIEWCDATFNPWIGCTKVSIAATGGGGCDHCYAEASTPARVLRAKGAETWGAGAPRVRTSAANWKMPLRWNAQADAFFAQHGRRQRVFCASLADVFDNAVDPQWRIDLFDLIAATPNLDWLLLTKRIGNAFEMIKAATAERRAADPGVDVVFNVWLGATVVNQAEADRDIPKLQDTPAAVRFLSMEPLLGPVWLGADGNGCFGGISRASSEGEWTFSDHPLEGKRSTKCGEYSVPRIDWVIVGGESGPQARPAQPDWVRSLRDQCQHAHVPFFFKQWGEWAPYGRSRIDSELLSAPKSLDEPIQRFGKKLAGRLLDGREWNEVPHGAA